MTCNFRYCKYNYNKIPHTVCCIWCNRTFHKQCAIYQHDIRMMLNLKSFECNFCNPFIPFTLSHTSGKGLKIVNLGDYIEPELESTKFKRDKNCIFPIGFHSIRLFPSYKNPNNHTYIQCQILCVDENYLQSGDNWGSRDKFLFKITFEDDIDHPIEVLHSPCFISPQLQKRFAHKKRFPSGQSLFGINDLYIQYLISLHLYNAFEYLDKTSDEIYDLIENTDVISDCISTHSNKICPEYIYDNMYTPVR